MNTKITRNLSFFGIIMITVISVDSIRNLPATALFGSSLIFFFCLAALCFLLPSALISAELAASHPHSGGVYAWVSDAFGELAGFYAIWYQWVENIIWYPTILSFLAGTVAYLISPELASNKYFLVTTILILFWSITLINLKGIRVSALFSEWTGMLGVMLPLIFIIALGGIWIFKKNPLQIDLSVHSVLPHFSDPNVWVSLTAVVLSLCGIEIATVHANDVKNPQKDYPKALLISVAIIVSTLILGGLAIAIVVPRAEINLVAGFMQAFHLFFTAYHIGWILPFVTFFIVLGLLGTVSNWIIAPLRGLLYAAVAGNLPPLLHKVNRHNAPSNLLLCQAFLVSIVATVFLLLPSVNVSYWLLTALAAQLYMLMYLLLFAAGYRLRCKYPDIKRPFKIPGGQIGIGFTALLGMLSATLTFIVGFIPEREFNIGSLYTYEGLIIGGLVLLSLPPLIMYKLRKPRWKS